MMLWRWLHMLVGQLFGLIVVGLSVHVTIEITNYSRSERFSNQILKTKECGKLRKGC